MRTTLVVGGTGGLGRAIVEQASAAGDRVVLTYLRAADSAAELCAGLPGPAEAVALDVRDRAGIDEVVARAAGDEGQDLMRVVYAAGSGIPRATLATARRRHWDWTFQTHARATAELFQASLAPLARTGGTYLTLSSAGSRVALPLYALTGPAKAAVEATVRYAAVEAAPHGVRVNALSPGLVLTRAIDAYPDHDRWIADAVAQTPLGRLVRPEEVAEAAAWLDSPAASMITGQIITIDGGWELRGGIT